MSSVAAEVPIVPAPRHLVTHVWTAKQACQRGWNRRVAYPAEDNDEMLQRFSDALDSAERTRVVPAWEIVRLTCSSMSVARQTALHAADECQPARRRSLNGPDRRIERVDKRRDGVFVAHSTERLGCDTAA